MHPPPSQLGIWKQIYSGRGCNKILTKKTILYVFPSGNSPRGCVRPGQAEAHCVCSCRVSSKAARGLRSLGLSGWPQRGEVMSKCARAQQSPRQSSALHCCTPANPKAGPRKPGAPPAPSASGGCLESGFDPHGPQVELSQIRKVRTRSSLHGRAQPKRSRSEACAHPPASSLSQAAHASAPACHVDLGLQSR